MGLRPRTWLAWSADQACLVRYPHVTGDPPSIAEGSDLADGDVFGLVLKHARRFREVDEMNVEIQKRQFQALR